MLELLQHAVETGRLQEQLSTTASASLSLSLLIYFAEDLDVKNSLTVFT